MTRNFKGGFATCNACNKVLYASRKEAKRVARYRYPGARGLNAYYCPHGNGWHFGNLPPGGRDQARRILWSKRQAQ